MTHSYKEHKKMIPNSRVDDDKVWMNWSWQHMQTISFIRSNQIANNEHVWFIFYVDFIWRPHSIPNYCSKAMNNRIVKFLWTKFGFLLSFKIYIPRRYLLMYQMPIQEEENVDLFFLWIFSIQFCLLPLIIDAIIINKKKFKLPCNWVCLWKFLRFTGLTISKFCWSMPSI